MKTIRAFLFIFTFIAALTLGASAQIASKKEQKEQQKIAEIAALINQKQFVFSAQSVTPMSGRFRMLSATDYDVKITKDSVYSYLPYFGRSYTPPINVTQSPLDFISTNFTIITEPAKKGGWYITLKPTDAEDVREYNFQVSSTGYTTLRVTSTNKQSISFNGVIVPIKS